MRLTAGDTVLWYWAQFGIAGGPKTLVLSRVGKTPCYRVQAQDDNGNVHPGARRRPARRQAHGEDAGRHSGGASAASGRIEACSCAPRSAAPCARTRWREPSCPRPRRRRALAGCGGEDSGKATLWITRDKGAHVILRGQVPAGLDGDAGARSRRGRSRRATAVATSSRSTGSRARLPRGATGSTSSTATKRDRSAAEYRLRRRRRRVVGLPLVADADAPARRRRRVSRAVPARLRRRRRAGPCRLPPRLAASSGGATGKSASAAVDQGHRHRRSERARAARPWAGAVAPRAPGGTFRAARSCFTFTGDPALLLRTVPFGRYRYQVAP